MIFYSQEVHEQVALHLTEHGCRMQTERQPPDDDYARKMAQEFMVRMQKSVPGSQYPDSKQPTH